MYLFSDAFHVLSLLCMVKEMVICENSFIHSWLCVTRPQLCHRFHFSLLKTEFFILKVKNNCSVVEYIHLLADSIGLMPAI